MFKYRNPLSFMLRTGMLPNRAAELYGYSPTTLRKYRSMAIEKGLTADQMDEMTDSALCAYLSANKQTSTKIFPDWQAEIEYLEKGYNRSEAHMRYIANVPAGRGLSYSSYCENLRKHLKKRLPIFRHIHVPGRSEQSDFAGYEPVGLNEAGERCTFSLFVCVLPFSHYIFAEATRSESTSDHIHCHVSALEYYGGAPEIITTDNLKASVVGFRARRVPIINPRFLAFGEYYNVDMRPARPRTPTDKASVEGAVKLVQRLLRLRLNERPLLPLAEINKLLRQVVEDWNNRPMKRAGGQSRRQKFLGVEKDLLQPLPAERMSFIDPAVKRRVNVDYHVAYDNVFYSVDHKLIDKEVSVRASDHKVEIRHDNEIVAIHARSYTQFSYVTLSQHRPPNHLSYLKNTVEDWAVTQHPLIAEWALACVPAKTGRRDKERILVRLRNTRRIFGQDRLVKAIERAKENDALNYRFVNDMLENNMEAVRLDAKRGALSSPSHNVRGAEYFWGGQHGE